jgi:DNA invertase Pin-like site-specific DNA recombinase
MIVALYARVSTDDQSMDQQEIMMREYCRRNNYEIYDIYKDVYTGSSDKRPDFNRMLDDMRAFKFELIIVTKIDRIGRSLQHLLSLLNELENKKVSFVAVTQNIDTSSSMGRLQMQIMGAFAEFERSLISERTKDGLKGKLNVGKRGPDKHPRKRRGSTIKIVYKTKIKKETANSFIRSKYMRTCKRCGIRYATKYRLSKTCPDCWGGTKDIDKT